MRSVFFLAMAFLSTNLLATPNHYIQGFNFVDLTLDQPSILLNIGYPGLCGKACKIELRSNSPWPSEKGLQALTEALLVQEVNISGSDAKELTATQVNPVAIYDLKKLSTYVTWVEIKTRSGKDLKSVIAERAHEPGPGAKIDPKAIVQLRPCDPK